MNSALDCIPCFVSQGLKVARLATANQKLHEWVLREVLRRSSQAESLDGCAQNIFFLFKVKCPVVARHIGHPVGSLAIHRHTPAATPTRRMAVGVGSREINTHN